MHWLPWRVPECEDWDAGCIELRPNTRGVGAERHWGDCFTDRSGNGQSLSSLTWKGSWDLVFVWQSFLFHVEFWKLMYQWDNDQHPSSTFLFCAFMVFYVELFSVVSILIYRNKWRAKEFPFWSWCNTFHICRLEERQTLICPLIWSSRLHQILWVVFFLIPSPKPHVTTICVKKIVCFFKQYSDLYL